MSMDESRKIQSKLRIGFSVFCQSSTFKRDHVCDQSCVSGMTAVICTYPLDVVRARLAFQVTGEHRYTGIANAFHTIYLKVVLVHS